jgi:phage-related tail protein
MTSPEQRELMGNLKELIRKGDMAGAKQLLASAVDMGTIAIVVTDHVEDPALLASLDKLGVEGQRSPAPQAPASAAADTAALEKSLAELKASLEQERNRAEAASREVRSVQEQLAAAKAGAAKTAELESALTKAREQAAAAARDLENAQRQLAASTEKDTRAAEFRQAAAREKERAGVRAGAACVRGGWGRRGRWPEDGPGAGEGTRRRCGP